MNLTIPGSKDLTGEACFLVEVWEPAVTLLRIHNRVEFEDTLYVER